MQIISILVAADPNGVIGKDNTIPWHISDDLKLFKRRTLGSTIIMGRNTWDSLPKKPLSGRANIVVSRNIKELSGAICCSSLEEAISKSTTEDVFIIGGEQIYNLTLKLNLANRIILSRVRKKYEGNKFFHVPEDWRQVEKDVFPDFDVIYYSRG